MIKDTSTLFDRIINVTLYSRERQGRTIEVYESAPRIARDSISSVLDPKKGTISRLAMRKDALNPKKEFESKTKIQYEPYVRRAWNNGKLMYVYRDFVPSNQLPLPQKGLDAVGQVSGITYTEKDAYRIECNKYGIKPDIVVKYSLLDGYFIYQIDVDIKNFHCPCDLRELDAMTIQVGYAPDRLREFKCTIFSSYPLTPGPDGITRFHCVEVDKFNEMKTSRSVKFEFNNRDDNRCVPLQNVVAQLTAALVYSSYTKESTRSLVTKYQAPKEVLDWPIPVSQYKYFSNAFQALTWVQGLIQTHINDSDINKKAKSPLSVSIQITDGELLVVDATHTNLPKEATSFDLGILVLDHITHAQFNGPMLSVMAPYVPELKPGDIFEMSPNYIDGANLPNENYGFSESLFRGVKDTLNRDRYRVITMSIEFGTYGSTNTMSILAVPLVYDEPDFNLSAAQNQVVQIKQALVSKQRNDITTTNGAPADTKYEEWWQGTSKIAGGDDYEVNSKEHPWDIGGLSAIAREKYRGVTKFTVSASDLGNRTVPFPNTGIMSGVTNTHPYPKYTGEYLWPIIAAATYHAMITEQKKKPESQVLYKVDLQNPNFIDNGWHLHIPAIPDDNSVKKHANQKEIFNNLAKIMLKQADGTSRYLGMCFANIYVYLGGTWKDG